MTEKEYLAKIGANINQFRKKRGITINELALRCEVEKSNLIPILKGRNNVTFKTLYKVAVALEVDVKEFLK